MKKVISIIILCIIALLLVGAILLNACLNRPLDNPDSAVGNHGGNLNNGGYFCEYQGKVYFSNAYDGYSLYSMNTDGTHIKKLTNVPALKINVAGDHIYFYQDGSYEGGDLGSMINPYGLYRCDLDGDDLTCLYRSAVGSMLLVGDYVYAQLFKDEGGVNLSRININGGDPEVVEDFIINPSSGAEGIIYYNGTVKNHCLYKLNTKTCTSTLLYDGSLWNPVIQDNYVYYMDLENDYIVCRLNLSNGQKTILTDESVDLFAVGENYIFYQTRGENGALKRVALNGQNETTIIDGVFTNINVTSEYVYFNEFNAGTPVYRVSANGGTQVETFDEAKEAAMKN